MFIKQKKVVNIEKYLTGFKSNEDIYISLPNVVAHKTTLEEAGFTKSLVIGEKVLPSIFGSVSRYNAEGKYKVDKTLPKEPYCIIREWTWTQYDGTEESKIVYDERMRYARVIIPPPSIELEIVKNAGGEKIIVSDLIKYETKNLDTIKHTVNLFLEIFGECEILGFDLKPTISTKVVRLNWTVLPKGKYPWEKMKTHLAPIFAKLSKNKIAVITERFETVTKEVPDFAAIGNGGFNGYVVFGFPAKNLFILESSFYGHATYIFDKNWENLSKMTKAQILDGNLQKNRLIHREGWTHEIEKLLSK